MLVRAGSRLCPTTLENANEDCPVLTAYSVALTCRVFPGERDHFLFASIAVTSGSEKKKYTPGAQKLYFVMEEWRGVS